MERNVTLTFSEEQAELLEVAQNFCRDKSPVSTVRKLIEDELGYDPAVWQEMIALGWLGIAVPEEFGGVGLSMAEVVPVVEQMSRRLMGGPFVPTTLAAQALLVGGTEAQKSKILPEICAGKAATLALTEPHADWDLTHIEAKAAEEGGKLKLSGTKIFVVDAASAEWIIASVMKDGEPALVIIEKAGLPEGALRREVVADETRRSFRLELDGVEVPADALLDTSRTRETLAHIDLASSLLLSAEACGAAASCVDYTVEYLKTRKQFGKLIGSYQSLKHPTVDALVAYETARSHLYNAACTFGQQGEGEIAVRMAKSESSDALSFAADRAIQFHGGFGFTYECDAQLYRRRGMWCEYLHGDGPYQRAKLADLLF
ncbi:acyl-CoA dehydrogenase family protein [Parvibaculum sp. MBR-TMA-1.3b-4.2]|jgi:alkylation response protein AidB-like acyl-CoA dehydrogenase